MKMPEFLRSLFVGRPRRSIDRMESHSKQVMHTLANVRVKLEFLSRLVNQMRDDDRNHRHNNGHAK